MMDFPLNSMIVHCNYSFYCLTYVGVLILIVKITIESDVASDDESMVGSDDESEGYFDVDVSNEAIVDDEWMVNQHLIGFVGGIGRRMVREELTSLVGSEDKKEENFE